MDEKLNADAMGMRMAGVAGRGDGTTQFAANGLPLRAHFPDCGRRFDRLGWLYSLGLLNFSSLLHGCAGSTFSTAVSFGSRPKRLTEPAGDFLDDLRQPLNR